MWGMIATWRMAYEGMVASLPLLKAGGNCGGALEKTIGLTEDYPFYKSVGYGGLPNYQGEVTLDAAFMNGDTFQIGAVAGLVDVANPISVARKLSEERFNNFLIGSGARQYALEHGFAEKKMLTQRAEKIWQQRLAEVTANGLSPYDGHDTIGMVSLDQAGSMAAGTSSSGLFMKKAGRVGDSPLSGSGFYCDSEIGGATATGLGEDLMKGCLSYETVRLMSAGRSPMVAAQEALGTFSNQLTRRNGKVGAMSLVAMNKQGQWGVASNVAFTFCVATETAEVQILMASPNAGGELTIAPVSQAWLAAYQKRITAPIE